jgi:hypothetical protein
MRLATLLVLGAIVALPALARELPPLLKPRQDVTITYRLPNPLFAGGEHRLQTFVAAATGRQRQENAGLVGITDPQAKRRYVFSTNRQDALYGRVMEQPVDDDEMNLQEVARDPDFQVTRLGTDQVAGLACTRWRVREVQDPVEDGTELCLAVDGVVLRSRAQRQGVTEMMEAVRVEYGPLDPALFLLPPDWPVQR